MSKSRELGQTAVLIALIAAARLPAAEPEPHKTFKTTAGQARALTFAPDGKTLSAIESVPQPAAPRGATVHGGRGRVVGGGGGAAPGGVNMSAYDRIVTWKLVKTAKPTAFNSTLPEELTPKIPSIDNPGAAIPMPAPGLVMTHVDDRTLVGATADGRLRVWDRGKGGVRATLRGFSGNNPGSATVGAVVVSPDRKLVAACARLGGDLQLWDVSTGKLVAEAEPGQVQFTSLAFAPDSQRLVITGEDYIEVFDGKGKSQKYIDAGGLGVLAASFLPGDNVLRTFNEEKGGGLRDWDLKSGRTTRASNNPRVLQAQGGKRPVLRKALFSPDGSLLVIVRPNKPFVLYDAHDGESLARFDQCKTAIPDAVFSQDGNHIATTTGENNEVKVWDVFALRGGAKSDSPSSDSAENSRHRS